MAHLPIEVYLALRYLDIRKKSFFNVLTVAISVGGVALGVASLVITLAVMSGFQTEIRSRIIGFNPHIVVFRPTEISKIASAAGISEKSVKPFILEQTVIQSAGATSGALIKGIDDNSTAGLKPMELKLGRDLARALGVSVGDDVALFVKNPEMSSLPAGGIQMMFPPRMVRLKVAEFFETGMYEYDANTAVASIETARSIFGMKKNEFTALGIFLDKNPDSADDIARKIIARVPDAQVRTWRQMNRTLFAALKLEKIMMFIILALIVLVAAFNIVSNLVLFVSQKAPDIGVLKSMGIARDKILKVFMGVGLLLGSCGISVGLLVGLGVCGVLLKYDIIRLPADIYFISRLPVKIFAGDVLWVVGVSILITLLATLWPAWKAADMDASEILKKAG